jgi:environmental stress-induced protein Ves
VSARRFVLAEIPPQPWKNRGGATREILSWPIGSDVDGFAWRVSLAGITADGPFSTFPGVDRTIALLRGCGVRLRGAGIDHQLDRVGVPFAFDGSVPLDCTLIDRPCEVLNVMARRNQGRARLDIVTDATSLTATHALLLSLRGEWQIGAEQIGSGTGLWWAAASHSRRLQPTAPSDQLAIIRWEPT